MFEICLGGITLACIILIIYLLSRTKGPVSIEKRVGQGNIQLKIRANKDIKELEVKTLGEAEEEIAFVRKVLKKDEVVEFTLPLTKSPLHIIVRYEGGSRTLEV